jgi:hypothetical protein
MDFADADKCRIVQDLNTVVDEQIAQFINYFADVFEAA